MEAGGGLYLVSRVKTLLKDSSIFGLYESKFSPSTCKKNHDFDQAITNFLSLAFPFCFLGSKSLGADHCRYSLL